MSKAVEFLKMVESNGDTVYNNNMKKKHNIPIGSLVEVKYSEWHGDGACSKVICRLWVYEHTRDCDGTPLYNLTKDVLMFDKNRDSMRLVVDGYIITQEMTESMLYLKTGFPEESLTVIPVDDDVKRGVGALKWDDD